MNAPSASPLPSTRIQYCVAATGTKVSAPPLPLLPGPQNASFAVLSPTGVRALTAAPVYTATVVFEWFAGRWRQVEIAVRLPFDGVHLYQTVSELWACGTLGDVSVTGSPSSKLASVVEPTVGAVVLVPDAGIVIAFARSSFAAGAGSTAFVRVRSVKVPVEVPKPSTRIR